MGRRHGWDNSWDVKAMSNYNTITSISESPVREGVIYAGTDDGIIQVTTNSGESWKKIPVTKLGLPARTFINDIKADNFDANTVYVSLDNHKEGDFDPYLYKSTDLGETWTSISSNLPKRNLVWRLVQDHVAKNLMFCATETAIYVTINGGSSWSKVPGSPTISFRDIAIQKRENDLVGASFGRGFYVLDDYSALREMSTENLSKEGKLFNTRDALWYIPKSTIGNTGGDYYFAQNPDFGAVFTYHLSESYPSMKSSRVKKEKEMIKKGQQIPGIDWDAIEKEGREETTKIYIVIKNLEGEIINKISAPKSKGLNRVAWNLRHSSATAINPDRLPRSGGRGGWYNSGILASPGNYTATLVKESEGVSTELDDPISFNVVDLERSTLDGMGYEEYSLHADNVLNTQNRQSVLMDMLNETMNMVKAMRLSLSRSESTNNELSSRLFGLEEELNQLSKKVYGNSAKSQIGVKNDPTVSSYIGNAYRGLTSTYGPTGQHKQSINIASSMLDKLYVELDAISSNLPNLKVELDKMNAPLIIGANN
tara:strand:- start:927 stop:2546 length:1620 start_codon:yes stop_codon:yes gene_type:complete